MTPKTKSIRWQNVLPYVLFIIFRLPSLFEKYWYRDEGIYAALAKGMYDGKVLYSGVWDHKPPLLYWTYYIAGLFGWGTGLFLLKLTIMILGLITIYFVAKTAKLLFESNKASIIAAFFASFILGLPLIEGDVVNAEVFYVTINAAILYMVARNIKQDKHSTVSLIGLGFLSFLSFGYKIPSFVETVFLLFVYAVVLFKRNGLKKILKPVALLAIGFLVPFAIMIANVLLKHSMQDFIQTVFLQNLSYSTEQDSQFVFLGASVLPPSIIKPLLFLTFLGISVYGYLKDKIAWQNLLLITVIGAEFYASTLSGRNYPHYMIQVVPGIVLFAAWVISKFKKGQFASNFAYAGILIACMQLITVTFTKGQTLYGFERPAEYYASFTKSSVRSSTTPVYWEGSPYVSRLIDFSNYYNQNYSSSDSFYLYAEEPWVIALIKAPSTNKYVVWYHLTFNPKFVDEEIENRSKARYLIIDEKVPSKVDGFFRDLKQFEKVDEFDGFTIYINNDLMR